ncbi:hypothetical protein EDD21DRAFT_200106 [Dissophora ornata]|nr:hypothetical protein EDD21DRAFT_200106 [Dissophora ornata]
MAPVACALHMSRCVCDMGMPSLLIQACRVAIVLLHRRTDLPDLLHATQPDQSSFSFYPLYSTSSLTSRPPLPSRSSRTYQCSPTAMTSRPRNLLDLPDEILCLILGYCCQDVDFLLWSCPQLGTRGQCCHNCRQCLQRRRASSKYQLHSNRPRGHSDTKLQRSTSGNSLSDIIVDNSQIRPCNISSGERRLRTVGNVSSSSSTSNSAGNETILRTRRRRTIAEDNLGVVYRGGCEHMGPQGQQDTALHGTFWSRHFARFILPPRQRSHPCPPMQHLYTPGSSYFITPMRSSIMLRSPQSSHKSGRLSGSEPSKMSTQGTTATAPTPFLAPLAFLESIPLPQGSLSHAAIQSKSYAKSVGEIQHEEKEDAAPTSLSHVMRRRPRSVSMSSNLSAAAACSYSQVTHRSSQPSSLEDAAKVSLDDDSVDEAEQGATGDEVMIEDKCDDESSYPSGVLTPFQLLLVNKRLADLTVRLLWKNIVFHGHDVCRTQALLSTLHMKDAEDEGLSCTCRQCGSDIRLSGPGTSASGLCATIDRIRSESIRGPLCRHTFRDGKQGTRASNGEWERGANARGDRNLIPAANRVDRRPRCNVLADVNNTSLLLPRWSYRRLVKRVVLNFAHPQASPELLVKALECLGSRCQDQVQVLDLHANEKMQAAGLESPAELQRLFSSGFSQLRYLRLQGGLLDNQLLGALIKGFSAPLAQPCQLSHVFLGPGSVTDSAIDNLIAVAGHCLEVFTVTSCVDFSGGALASLLTKCPKLRVLSVHRALARDKELLEELGVEIESNAPPSNSSALVTLNQHEPSRKEIIAPLERLELGTVKLTTVGISEIIRGTYQSLRFLVLETQHFKEDFLIDVVAKLCMKLEGLHFDDTSHSSHQQQQHQATQGHTARAEQRPRRRFFEFRRTRRALDALHQHPHPPQHHHHPQGVMRPCASVSQQHAHSSRGLNSAPRQSPWLGETSTDDWVQYGDCALWAVSTIESTVSPENNGTLNATATNPSSLLRARNFSAFFRAISRRLVSLFSSTTDSPNVTGHGSNIVAASGVFAVPTLPTDPGLPTNAEIEYERLLERFGVRTESIDAVLQSLQTSLKAFTASRMDLMLTGSEASKGPVSEGEGVIIGHPSSVLAHSPLMRIELSPEDRLETFLRLVVLLGVLVFGAATSIQAA